MATIEQTATQECPFSCGKTFSGNSWYQLTLHIEEEHTEDSPFVVREDDGPAEGEEGNAENSRSNGTKSKEVDDESIDSEEEMDEYTLCPEEGCGEVVLLIDYVDHLDLHQAENAIIDDSASCYSTTTTSTSLSNKTKTSSTSHGSGKSSSSASGLRSSEPPSGSVNNTPSSTQSHHEGFPTTIPPTLHPTNGKSKPNVSSQKRRGLLRPFTKFADRTASKSSSYRKREVDDREPGDRIKRLGVSGSQTRFQESSQY